MATAVGFAGLLQLLMLTLRAGDEKLAAPLRVTFDEPMRGFFVKGMAGMVANSGPQLLIMAGAVIASSSPAAVSWLYFANRLIELPLGIVGTAMGTVLVPELSRAVRSGDHAAIVSEPIEIASGTGWRYARISGDFNPIHLTDRTAGMFGFKQSVAHGMWSLGRCLGSAAKDLFSQDVICGIPFWVCSFQPKVRRSRQ